MGIVLVKITLLFRTYWSLLVQCSLLINRCEPPICRFLLLRSTVAKLQSTWVTCRGNINKNENLLQYCSYYICQSNYFCLSFTYLLQSLTGFLSSIFSFRTSYTFLVFLLCLFQFCYVLNFLIKIFSKLFYSFLYCF